MLADPPLLERVIANLVGNAVRHAPAGARSLLTASALAGGWNCGSSTGGPGCRRTDRERLFEPFQRLGRHRQHHRPRASASPSPGASPRRWTARSPRRTLPAAA